MTDIILIITALLALAIIFLLIRILARTNKPAQTDSLKESLAIFGNNLDKINNSLKDEFQRNREESSKVAKDNRDELLKSLESFDNSVLKSAKTINQKYISPPVTTNFAIMFVPTEGLYAQILTRTGLFEQVQRECNITVVGPSNLVAFLSSLQMGFRTLAVQKRSSEVWQILGAVKTEFESFEKVLEKAQNQLISASGNIEKLVGTRSRAIKRKLRNIQELPVSEASRLLESNEPDLKDFEEENDELEEDNG